MDRTFISLKESVANEKELERVQSLVDEGKIIALQGTIDSLKHRLDD